MYFPYLRGNQYDYLAVREADPTIYQRGKVLPIIEPVKLSPASFRDLSTKGIGAILIANPAIGALTPRQVGDAVDNHLNAHPNLTIGFNIDGGTSLRTLRTLFDAYADFRKALVFHADNNNVGISKLIADHSAEIDWVVFVDGMVSTPFITSFRQYQRVLVTDSFHKLIRNADYPPVSHYPSTHTTFTSNGFQGFGDFLTMPYDIRLGGGPAHAVAIHLTSEKAGVITCNHFVSDDKVGAANVAGKYEQARVKASRFLTANPRVNVTSGATSFHTTGFPGLGSVKKRSMIHHLEMMATLVP